MNSNKIFSIFVIFLFCLVTVLADSITPDPAYNNDDLVCNLDQSGVAVYKWFKNGAQFNLNNDKVLEAVYTSVGEDWRCEGWSLATTHTIIIGGRPVVINDPAALKGQASITISNTLPIVNANGPYTGIEGQSISFTGTASDPVDNDQIIAWQWDFEDGQTSTEQNPIHTYDQNGTYIVTLTVTDSHNGQSTATTTADIADTVPVVDFSISINPVDEGVSVDFTDLSTAYDGIASWEWDIENDGIVDYTTQNVNHIYMDNGTYTINLTVTDNDGSVVSTTYAIDVNDLAPTALFAANATVINEGESIEFTDLSTSPADDIVAWSWDVDGDGLEDYSAQNIIHTYLANGTYDVTLTVTDEDGSMSTSDITVIVVNDLGPVADFNISQTTVDEGDAVDLTDNSYSWPDDITEWYWDVDNDGNVEYTTQDANHVYNCTITDSTCMYTINLTVVDEDGSSDSVTYDIFVNDLGPSAAITSNVTSIVEGESVEFTDLSTSLFDRIISWYWNFGDGNDSNQQNPVHTYMQNGTYYVNLTVTDEDGSMSTSDILTITVNDTAPTANFSVSSNNVYVNETVNFTDLSIQAIDQITNWNWDFDNDGTTDDTNQNASYSYSTPGNYTVNLTVIDSDGSVSSAIQTITVNAIATPQSPNITSVTPTSPVNINITDSVLFNITAEDPEGSDLFVNWTVNGAEIFNETILNGSSSNFTYQFNINGTFIVAVTVIDNQSLTDTEMWTVYVVNMTIPNNAPVVNLISPANNVNLTTENVTFEYEVVDDFSSSLTCNLYINGILNSTKITSNGTIDSINVSLSDGSHTWNITCSDGSLIGASETRIININTTSQDVHDVAIDTNYTQSVNGIRITDSLGVNLTDVISNLTQNQNYTIGYRIVNLGTVQPENVNIKIYSGSILLLDHNRTINNWFNTPTVTFNASMLSLGLQNITLNVTLLGAVDDNLTNNFAYRTVNVISATTPDTTPPSISIISPLATTYNYTNILVNISASDNVAVDRIWFNWNGTDTDYIAPLFVNFTDNSIITLTAYVNDTSGNVNSANVTFTVNTTAPYVNYAPNFTTNPVNTTWHINTPFTFDVNATDLNPSDVLTFSDNIAQFDIDPVTGIISFTPNAFGAIIGTITVCDNSGYPNNCTSQPFSLTVTNNAPVLGTIGPKFVNEGELLTFTINATDADNDTLTYSASSLPSGATFVNQTFSWMPNFTQAGTYQVLFNVSDGYAQDTELVTITVNNVVQNGTINGFVLNNTGSGISGATVEIKNGSLTVATVQTGIDGYYTVNVRPGTYTVLAYHLGYVDNSANVNVVEFGTTTQNITLQPVVTTGNLTGVVKDSRNNIYYAVVELRQGPAVIYSTTTDVTGRYTFTNANIGSYTLVVTKAGFNENSQAVSVSAGTTTRNVTLTPAPTSGTISGTVRNENNTAITQITNITISKSTGQIVQIVQTDSSGYYAIYGLPATVGFTYDLDADILAGYSNVYAPKGIGLNTSQTKTDMDIYMI